MTFREVDQDHPMMDAADRSPIQRMLYAAILRAILDYEHFAADARAAEREIEALGDKLSELHGMAQKGLKDRIERFDELRKWFNSGSTHTGSFVWMAQGAWPGEADGRIQRCRRALADGSAALILGKRAKNQTRR